MRPYLKSSQAIQLLKEVTCPHCWEKFPPERIHWIATHPSLNKDAFLAGQQERFLPSRFDVNGRAIDVNGSVCESLACPHCHLSIPRDCLEMESLFVSIIGAPYSGKSYYLTSMIHRMETSLLDHFRLAFGSSDPAANQLLNEYVEKFFHNPQDDVPVALPKTQKESDLYEGVRFGERTVWYPKPFLYYMRPDTNHPYYEPRSNLSRVVCMYDNAGEHFIAGGETTEYPCKHLALSSAVMFLFDPMQHPQFRRACQGKSNDPQLGPINFVHPQHQVLNEVEKRIRINHVPRLSATEKYKRPLVMVVTKYDAWASLLNMESLNNSTLIHRVKAGVSALNLTKLAEVSDRVRTLLRVHAREVVEAAEKFFSAVYYIPVSALGCSPEKDPISGGLMVRPRNIKPIWSEIPMLFAMHLANPRLIPVGRTVLS